MSNNRRLCLDMLFSYWFFGLIFYPNFPYIIILWRIYTDEKYLYRWDFYIHHVYCWKISVLHEQKKKCDNVHVSWAWKILLYLHEICNTHPEETVQYSMSFWVLDLIWGCFQWVRDVFGATILEKRR